MPLSLPPAIGRAVAFDPGGLAPAAAVRSALGVATPLVIGAAAGHPADGAMAAAGALPVGIAAMSGDQPAPPLALLLSTTVGMSLSTFVGSLCAGHVGAVLATLAAWGFVSGVLVALGRAATITGVQAVIGLIVFGRYPGGVGTSALHALAVLTGGLIQTLFAVVLRPPVALRSERQALAELYQRLAALAAGSAYGGPSGEAIASTSAFLARRAPEIATLRDLVDEAARVRLELQALQSVPDVPGVEEVTGAAAEVVASVRSRRTSPTLSTRSAEPPPHRPAVPPGTGSPPREPPHCSDSCAPSIDIPTHSPDSATCRCRASPAPSRPCNSAGSSPVPSAGSGRRWPTRARPPSATVSASPSCCRSPTSSVAPCRGSVATGFRSPHSSS